VRSASSHEEENVLPLKFYSTNLISAAGSHGEENVLPLKFYSTNLISVAQCFPFGVRLGNCNKLSLDGPVI
jgi:hypothetical protein